MKRINSTQTILSALLQGRVINQWDDAKEFATTRMGGIIFNIRKSRKLDIVSEPVEGKWIKAPVQYYCTPEAIQEYWKRNPVEYEFFTKINNNQYVMK
jgi:hypothetical protein